MKAGKIGWLLAMGMLLSLTGYSQSRGWLNVNDPQFSGEFVTVDYHIPYDGMLEIRIFDGEGKLIYQNQKIDLAGDNQVRLKTTPLEPGKAYILRLNYKKDEISKSLQTGG